MSDNTNNNTENEFTLELYKSLRDESMQYREKVPSLWLQKLIMTGGVIAFIVGKRNDLVQVTPGNTLLVAAILSIPILAVLLDAKILEYTLHARAISRFTKMYFPDPLIIGKWESCLWGDEGDSEITQLVKLRSSTTVIVTAIPTAILIILSGLVISEITKWHLLWQSLTGGVTAIYLISTLYVWRKVWPST